MDHVSRLVSFDIPSRGNFTRGTWEETGDSYQREDAIDRIGSDISERPTGETSPYARLTLAICRGGDGEEEAVYVIVQVNCQG
jgi:hypothetical protein